MSTAMTSTATASWPPSALASLMIEARSRPFAIKASSIGRVEDTDHTSSKAQVRSDESAPATTALRVWHPRAVSLVIQRIWTRACQSRWVGSRAVYSQLRAAAGKAGSDRNEQDNPSKSHHAGFLSCHWFSSAHSRPAR